MATMSRRYTKILIASLLGMLMLSLGVYLLAHFAGLGSNITSFRNGRFIYLLLDVTDNGWYFSAEEANGSNTFFVELSHEELANLVIQSDILSGEMTLVIAQDSQAFVLDLGERNFEKFIGDKVASQFEPGRIEMQLIFANAESVTATASWR